MMHWPVSQGEVLTESQDGALAGESGRHWLDVRMLCILGNTLLVVCSVADVREFGKESVESRKELYKVLSEECMVVM